MTSWGPAAFWFALLLAGQAAVLQTIDAGRLIHYQHFRPFERSLLLAAIAAYAAIVFVGLVRDRKIAAILSNTSIRWRLALAIAFVCLVSVPAGRDPGAYLTELAFASLLQVTAIANVALAASALPAARRAELEARTAKVLENCTIPAALWAVAVPVLLNLFSYERHPHLSDEVGYLYHARYFAAGMLAMPLPPVAAAFDLDLMTFEPHRWFSPVPPGWPAVLSLGVLAGVPWLVNPLLAGLNVLLASKVLRELYNARIAAIGTILLASSPWVAFLAMSYMTHTLSLTLFLLAMLGLCKSRLSGSLWWAALSGAAAGGLSLIRPLDALCVAIMLGLGIIGIFGTRLKIGAMAAFGLACAAIAAIGPPYNREMTGSYTKAPLMEYFNKYYGEGVNDLGFGPDRGVGWAIDPFPGHSPLDAVINANLNLFSLNIEMLGWITGSLILAALAMLLIRHTRTDVWMITGIAIVLLAYSLYYFGGGPDFGARYWYMVLIPLIALSARGIEEIERRAGSDGWRVLPAVGALCFIAAINYLPWRAADKYHNYLNMRPDVRKLAAEKNFGKSLVLIRGERYPDYASAAIYNPLRWDEAVPIYAWDHDAAATKETLRIYAGRPIWILEGPSLTGGAYRIVASPDESQNLLNRN